MTTQKKTGRRPSLQSIYAHHFLWGVVCFILIAALLGMWYEVQKLNHQNQILETKVATVLAPEPSCSARNAWKPGTTKSFTTLTENGSRGYSVHLPENFDKTAYYPLIVHFPGKGASVSGGAQQAGLDVLPAIIAYPHPTVGTDGYNAWQGAPYSSGANDVAFTAALLDKIQAQLCINREQVYATGMSNGGGMVSLLSCQLSDRFAAFGIVAGAMYYPAGACTPPTPTPLINIHGDNDSAVPYTGSVTRKLPDITSWSAERARDNGCTYPPQSTNIDALTTVTTWDKCRGRATVENIRMRGGGHLWYPEATQMLWKFMSRHTL